MPPEHEALPETTVLNYRSLCTAWRPETTDIVMRMGSQTQASWRSYIHLWIGISIQRRASQDMERLSLRCHAKGEGKKHEVGGTRMGDYAQVCCLFCMGGHEEAVVRAVQENGLGTAIFPRKLKRIRRKEQWETLNAPLLPGYVFVYQGEDDESQPLNRLEYVIRVLRYTDTGHTALVGEDRRFADWLWEQNGTVGVLKAVRVGERVEIVDGMFRAFSGRVVQMDRRKQAARVALDILGNSSYVWLSFDYLRERKDDEQT